MLLSLIFFQALKAEQKEEEEKEGGRGDRKKKLGYQESLEFSSKCPGSALQGWLALSLYSLLNDLSFGVGRLFFRTIAGRSLLLL